MLVGTMLVGGLGVSGILKLHKYVHILKLLASKQLGTCWAKCIYVIISLSLSLYTHIYIYIYKYNNTYIYMYTYVCICICICIHVCINIVPV